MVLLREQQAAGFADVAGIRVSATLPVSDRLLTRVVLAQLPPAASISAFELRAHQGNRLTIRVRLARPSFLPPFTIPFTIERQPDLPQSPVFVLRMGSIGGLLALAGPVVRFFDVLPPGVQLQNDRVLVDVKTLLEQHGAELALTFLEQLEITTDEGRVVVFFRAAVPPVPGGAG